MSCLDEAPTGWFTATIGDICEVVGGYPAPKDPPAFVPEGVPFVRMKDLGAYHHTTNLTEVADRLSSGYVAQSGYRILPKGAILLPRSGSVALNHRAILGVDAVIVSHICALVVHDKRVFNTFLYHILTRTRMDQITKKTTGLDAITFEDLRTIPVSFPSLPEQRRIAAILDKADAIRRKRRETIRLTDDFLRSIFLDMFGDPAVNSRGWETRPMGELIMQGDRINYGVVQPGDHVDDGVPIVRVGDFKDGHIDKTQIKRIAPHIERAYERSRLEGDEILIACVGSIGEIALADASLRGFNIVRAVARVRLRLDIQREYVVQYLRTSFAQGFFKNETRTVSQPTLNIRQMSEAPIHLPPFALRQRFADISAKHATLMMKEKESLSVSDEASDAMSQAAFKGSL